MTGCFKRLPGQVDFYSDFFATFFCITYCFVCYKRTLLVNLIYGAGFYFSCFLILFILGCLTPLDAFSAEEVFRAKVGVSANKYRIGAGDVLGFKVYHHPEFDQDAILVRPDGNASFPAIGEISVGNKTIEEISRILESHIAELVVHPYVMLTVTRTKPGIVYLAGAVMHPGMFQLTTAPSMNDSLQGESTITRLDMRLSNILANAGGVQLNADLSQVEVRRAETGEIKLANLWKMLKDGDGREDIWIESGDTVYVPVLPAVASSSENINLLLKSSVGPGAFPVRIIGQVNTPGVYELTGASPFLNSAIAKAGGYAPGANKTMVAIRRFNGELNSTVEYINPDRRDIALMPNDLVYVSENKTYLAGRFFEQAGKVLAPFGSIGSTVYGFAGAFGFGGFQNRWNTP